MACEAKLFKSGELIMSVISMSYQYGDRMALQDISLNFKAGKLYGLLGPNGSGKSTLFKCMLGLLKSRGEIKLGGLPLKHYKPRHLARHIAYVPQEHLPPFPYLVKEMVAMGRTPHRGYLPILSAHDHEIVNHAIKRVGLTELANVKFNHLSGGQRQLVLIARALAQEASLIFLDEPTQSLDFSNQLIVWERLMELSDEGVGIVICVHDPNHILWFCDEVVVLKHGRVIALGMAKEVINKQICEEIYNHPISTAKIGDKIFIYPSRAQD